MTDPLLPMTELDAVNSMLSSIGQSPVNSLDVVGIRDVSIAKLALDNVTREVLTRGWSWNSDSEYPLSPNANDNILIPSSALSVDPSRCYQDFVIRDNAGVLMLWDRDEHTFTITVDPVKVDIIWAFAFSTLPQAARSYIATRAARLFQSQVIGSDLLFKFTELHEAEALGTLNKIELRTKDRNILNSATETNLTIFHRILNPLR